MSQKKNNESAAVAKNNRILILFTQSEHRNVGFSEQWVVVFILFLLLLLNCANLNAVVGCRHILQSQNEEAVKMLPFLFPTKSTYSLVFTWKT